ncbi:hypothetical protein [Pandoraea sp. NPDC090278]|uniref:hypothetical protein n=1 Tax=Pandoraea sp. NPDC090278 TaxID=3364391 RepID=UPI00383AF676
MSPVVSRRRNEEGEGESGYYTGSLPKSGIPLPVSSGVATREYAAATHNNYRR